MTPPSQLVTQLRALGVHHEVALCNEAADTIERLHIDNHRSTLYFSSLMVALASLKSKAREVVECVEPHPHSPIRAVIFREELEGLIEWLAKPDPKLMSVEEAKAFTAHVDGIKWEEVSLVEQPPATTRSS